METVNTPPVLLVLFRREDTTRRVFDAIRKAQPTRLFLAADGPRPQRVGEVEACARTRAIVQHVDWPCEVSTFFRDENVGAGRNVAEAVTWFLNTAGEGVILEDDCLPHPDFFSFAAECLEKYREDTRIMHISGSSFRGGKRFSDDSYVFSRYNHGWGWATWRRAWSLFDPAMARLEPFLSRADKAGFWDSDREKRYWTRTFRQAKAREMDAWDYQWKYSVWKEGGLCLYPEYNLISNLGFGEHATNTFEDGGKGNRPWQPMGLVRHPEFVVRHRTADQANFQKMYWGTWSTRVKLRWRQVFRVFGRQR